MSDDMEMNPLSWMLIVPVTLVAGAFFAIFFTKKIALWVDVIREMDLVQKLRADNRNKEREIRLLKAQNAELRKNNALLEEEVAELRRTVAEVAEGNEKLTRAVAARDALIRENDKIVKALGAKVKTLEANYDAFREDLTGFMETVLGGEKAAEWKKFLERKTK